MEVRVYKTAEETCEQLALLLSKMTGQQSAMDDIQCTDSLCVALSGGSTPKLLFRIMAEQFRNTNWSKIRFFWVDERMVPPEDEESNFGEFYRILVTSGVVPEASLYPVRYNENEKLALLEADAVIRTNVPFVNGYPCFDLIILGIGEDGHTASIFPDNLQSFDCADIVEIAVHPQTKQHRITLTGTTINNAREIIFLCTGAGKKEILNSVLKEKDPMLPATHVAPSGNLMFMLDEAAVPG